MSDKKNRSGNTQAPCSRNDKARHDRDTADYGERRDNDVTNTFSPPTRPGKGGNDGGKSDR